MANVIKNSFASSPSDEELIQTIRTICESNPQSMLAGYIKQVIDKSEIPRQMDRDLMRRLTDPACNPRDINFQMPLELLQKNYNNA